MANKQTKSLSFWATEAERKHHQLWKGNLLAGKIFREELIWGRNLNRKDPKESLVLSPAEVFPGGISGERKGKQ